MSSSHSSHSTPAAPSGGMAAGRKRAQAAGTATRNAAKSKDKTVYWVVGGVILVFFILLSWRTHVHNRADQKEHQIPAPASATSPATPAAPAVEMLETPMTRVVLSKTPSTPVVVEDEKCIFAYMEGTGEDPEKTEVVLTGKKKDGWMDYTDYLKLPGKPKVNLMRWSGEGVLLYRFQKCSFAQ